MTETVSETKKGDEFSEHSRGLEWGLNLDVPEVTTQQEIDDFRRISEAQLGVQQDGLDFWLDEDPESLKRYRLWAGSLRVIEPDEAPGKWQPAGAVVYLYAMTGFEDGLLYCLHGASRRMTKPQILEELSLVVRWGQPRALATIGRAVARHSFPDPVEEIQWPKGWAPDPDAFKSGADFSTRTASADDTRKIIEWYERNHGEVPKHASFLAKNRPDMLKAYRQRYENQLRLLPKQTDPYTSLQLCMLRGFGEGIREALLLSRTWGITKPQILEAISWGSFYGGQESISMLETVGGDILDGWTE